MNIKRYRAATMRAALEQVKQDCRNAAIGCIDCKKLVADRVVERLAPMWEARANLVQHPGRLDEIAEDGRRRATAVSSQTMAEVREAMKI